MAEPKESSFSDSELVAYLEESLAVEVMSHIESALRADPQLMNRLARLNSARDFGTHTIGSIWRRHHLSCPPREQLGSYLLGALDEEWMDYVQFHVETVGCRLCGANLEDLRSQADKRQAPSAETRRRKYFQTSAGFLSKE